MESGIVNSFFTVSVLYLAIWGTLVLATIMQLNTISPINYEVGFLKLFLPLGIKDEHKWSDQSAEC
jgi:hypothetical protein